MLDPNLVIIGMTSYMLSGVFYVRPMVEAAEEFSDAGAELVGRSKILNSGIVRVNVCISFHVGY